ncbi:energy-coupling factor transporter transmembrane component T family protein [Thermofilum pendens]|uniref:Cobalt transport protein n=1 Tax=Thermofilum pendens (strain DSM 2475 / Hrk 5) TaxID=368408 RepID=A1RW37_THEPD|nr:energy-coupling factor transporter transmembrane component T [Thermofilum pendens]ABL77417.1 cobalt transport protein [Thermofilum pendens Hrk 5]
MLSGLYVERKSFFHSLDPRVKLLWATLVLAASIATQFNGLKSFPVFVSAIAALTLSGIGAGLAAVLIFNSLVFLLITTLVWAGMYSGHGSPVFVLGFLRITDVGLLVASGKFFLIMSPVFAFITFFVTTKPYHVAWTLEKMGMPSKVSTAFVIAVSLLPTMVKATRDVIDIQKLRGLALDRGSVLDRLRNYIPIIVPVISRLLSDVWDLSLVLASRYVGYSKRRTYLLEPRWSSRDTVFALLSLVFYGVIIAWGLQLL